MQGEYFETTSRDSETSRVGPFLLGKCLGEGTTGMVRLGIHADTKLVVAIKIIQKKFLNKNEERWKTIQREIAILKLVDHPNVLKLYDVLETNKRVYIILEHVKGGELFEYIIERGRLPEEESLRLLGQMVMGLQHCHEHWVCHRDLKPENLLLDSEKNIKIVDFGFAQVTRRWDAQLLKTACGSPHYTAPEVIAGSRVYDGSQSDVWSLGIIMFAMTTGMLPFDHPNVSILLRIVMTGKYSVPFFVSPLVVDLISKMLVVNPKNRIKMENIRSHKSFRKLCPDLYVRRDQSKSNSSDILKNTKVELRAPWNDGSELDPRILKDLSALGWGTVKYLEKLLMNDDVKQSDVPKSKKIDTNLRLDRAMYLLLHERKIKRVEILRRLSPKASSPKDGRKRSKSVDVTTKKDEYLKQRHVASVTKKGTKKNITYNI